MKNAQFCYEYRKQHFLSLIFKFDNKLVKGYSVKERKQKNKSTM